MPADHARKTAIRQRMARTGERYREAAHAIDLICARNEPPMCALHTSFWDCPDDCPHRAGVQDTPEYRAWAATPRPVPEPCPGFEACTDPDCPSGCKDVHVSICWDCSYVFGVTDDDPQDGSCPNGCTQFPRETGRLAEDPTGGH